MGLIQGIHVYDLHFYILSLEVIPNEQHCSDLLEHDRQYPGHGRSHRQGARRPGAQVDVFSVDQVGVDQVLEYDQLALGCHAMGAEVLEESEFEPFFSQLEGRLSGKSVALFGSYGWGDGQWMRDWEERTDRAGGTVCQGEGLILHETPDESGLDRCRALGATLAAS